MERIEEKHCCLCQLSQGGTFLLFPGYSKNYMIWKESTSVGTWVLKRITSPDTFLGTLSPATATLKPPSSFGFCPPAAVQIVLLIFYPEEYIYM